MRFRRPLPLLILLAPAFISAQLDGSAATETQGLLSQEAKDILTNEEILALNRAPKDAPSHTSQTSKAALADATSSAATSSSTSTKRYVGTEDAPVDGHDGKPHAGPFVDTTPEDATSRSSTVSSQKSKPTSLKKFEASSEDGWKLADIPEKNDGVMNDENRQIPKKGTTGTEGGISEKERTLGTKGKIGEEREPPAPKEQRPLPHSEEQRIEAAEEAKLDKSKTSKSDRDAKDAITGKTVEADNKKTGEYGDASHLLEKPKDLPEKPHNIPHPEPKVATHPDSEKGDAPPVGSGDRNKWVVGDLPDTDGKASRPAPKTTKSKTSAASNDLDWHEWVHSFVLSFAMIIFSEIGDKTFLVAALMAMRHTRWVVFSAAFSALIAMTVLSAVLGHAFPTLLPRKLTTFAAAVLFFVFGAKSLREGLAMPKHAGVGEEMKEVEAELEEKEHTMARRRSRAGSTSAFNLESGRGRKPSTGAEGGFSRRSPSPKKDSMAGLTNLFSLILSPAWVQTFIMTFLGEWGDRSQIATIAMAAGQDYWWVTLGAILGHACCTGIAVVGGRALAGRVSMRVVTIGGAVAFLVFGIIYTYECIVE